MRLSTAPSPGEAPKLFGPDSAPAELGSGIMGAVRRVLVAILTVCCCGLVAVGCQSGVEGPGAAPSVASAAIAERGPVRPRAAPPRPAAKARPRRAFPEAAGFGTRTTGGAGGRVMTIRNLADSGPGSLRACLTASGPRICAFAVSGTIELASTIDITNPFLTVAGQTAPGGGITVRAAEQARDTDAHIRIRTHDVVVRYLRLRPGTKAENARALSINGPPGAPARNVVIDHNSLSWSGDELLIAWDDTQHVTFSWNNLSESLDGAPIDSVGLKGPNLGEQGGGFYSFHHNLVAHHSQRLPNISAGAGPTDLINNVMYNAGGTGSRVLNGAQVNFVGNYIKAGPNTRLDDWFEDDGAAGFHLGGANTNAQSSNAIEGKDIELLPERSTSKIVPTPFGAPPVPTTSADRAYETVLRRAGAIKGLRCDGSWFRRPDPVDTRIVESVASGTTGHSLPERNTFERRGYISEPEDVGGWPALSKGRPCRDTDEDGLPDKWERTHGLRIRRKDAGRDADRDGYRNIEEFLNGTRP